MARLGIEYYNMDRRQDRGRCDQEEKDALEIDVIRGEIESVQTSFLHLPPPALVCSLCYSSSAVSYHMYRNHTKYCTFTVVYILRFRVITTCSILLRLTGLVT